MEDAESRRPKEGEDAGTRTEGAYSRMMWSLISEGKAIIASASETVMIVIVHAHVISDTALAHL